MNSRSTPPFPNPYQTPQTLGARPQEKRPAPPPDQSPFSGALAEFERMRRPILVLGLLQLAGSALAILFFLAGDRGTFIQSRGFPQLPGILALLAIWSGFTMINFSLAIRDLLRERERENLGRVLKAQKFVWLSLAVWAAASVVGNLIALFVSQYF